MRPARLPAQPMRGKRGGAGCSRGRDDRALEYRKRISGVVAIEHEHRPGMRVAFRWMAVNGVQLVPPTNHPRVVRSSRHAETVFRSDTMTTSSILACDSNCGTMLDPMPGMWRLRGAPPKMAEPSVSTAMTRMLG